MKKYTEKKLNYFTADEIIAKIHKLSSSLSRASLFKKIKKKKRQEKEKELKKHTLNQQQFYTQSQISCWEWLLGKHEVLARNDHFLKVV